MQILCYAARAMELALNLTGTDLEPEFLARLAQAPSNLSDYGNGAEVYRQQVLPSRLRPEQIVAHHAMGTMHHRWPQAQDEPVAGSLSSLAMTTQPLYCYDIETLDEQRQRLGTTRLAVGQIRLRSRLTQESGRYIFTVLHTGGLDFHCRVLAWGEDLPYQAKYEQLKRTLLALNLGNLSQVVLALARELERAQCFELADLFPEVRQRMMASIAGQTLRQLDQLYGQVYQDNAALLLAFRRDGDPSPQALQVAAQVALTQQVRSGLRSLLRDAQVQHQLTPAGLSQLAALESTAAMVQQLGCELTATDLPRLVVELLLLLLGPMVRDLRRLAQPASGSSSESAPPGPVQAGNAARWEPVLRLLRISQVPLGLKLNLEQAQEQLYEALRPLPVSQWPEAERTLARALGLAVPQSFGPG